LKINGNQVRKGALLLFEGGLWRVTKSEATKTGKSGAYNQVEMKNIVTGTKKNTRFRSSESVEAARLDERQCTYLYSDGESVILMDPDSYEQIAIPGDVVGEDVVFLDDGMTVTVAFYDGAPVSLDVPAQVTLAVADTEPAIKGQTASASYKPAVLANGVRITVPQFVNVGDDIVVDTSERSYVRRAE
jgi:elongation factor P